MTIRMKHKNYLWIVIVVSSINLSWAHQTLLFQMVGVDPYYDARVAGPFAYRILPLLLYRVLVGGHIEIGLNRPFGNSFEVFQLILDAIALIGTVFYYGKALEEVLPKNRVNFSLAASTIILFPVVVFGFFIVPNRALFYPYDFPDLFFAALVFWVAVQKNPKIELALPFLVFLATLNKETALFYASLYLIFKYKERSVGRLCMVFISCIGLSILARLITVQLASSYGGISNAESPQFQVQIAYTISQLKNPLLLFAMANSFGYLYLPVLAIRRHLDLLDYQILAVVAVWVLIMAFVGVVRELRIFAAPALLLGVILGRHVNALFGADGSKKLSP